MSDQRPDVHRLFQYYGLDPAGYLQFPNRSLGRQSEGITPSKSSPQRARPRISDPALRAARLRAELLQA